MLLIKILLIPFKLLLMLISFLLAIILKLIGVLIEALAHACGWFTNLMGSIITLLAIGYLICGYFGVANLNTIELWWVAGLTTGIVGVAVASMDMWADWFGDFLIDCGDNLIAHAKMLW
ncbi:MAG: hypothetical protein IJX63_03565 [Lachnospiraceae bacterium]|nr:hypothetical protein [Lachnospiraceae bacterium]